MQKIRTGIQHAFIIVLVLLLSACSFTRKSTVDPMNLSQLRGMSEATTAVPCAPEAGQLRYKALVDTALTLGAQGGLASTSEDINHRLECSQKQLETIYNFSGMMLSHGVLPPVLEEGDFTLNKTDCNTIRVSDKTYKIVKQACFVTTPPNWREYIWMSYERPEMPCKFLLPRNDEEKKVWANAVQKGWERGVRQANNIFREGLARLNRDYKGMALYRKLLAEHMISQPFVSRTELGITGDGESMNINDQVLRITDLPKLQTNGATWQAVVVKRDDS